MGRRGKRKKWRMHYNNSHTILLVGEGDFSFAACLATTFGSASNIVATSFDSEDLLLSKYGTASQNLELLEDLDCCIVHKVDANTMSRHRLLRHQLFDRIVFNFPHAGFQFKENDSRQIECHKELVRGFMKNARKMLTENGEIHITHKTSYPFTEWEIEKLAAEEDLILIEEANFDKCDYPGYHNKRGDGPKSGRTFPVGSCSTFKFVKSPNLGHLTL